MTQDDAHVSIKGLYHSPLNLSDDEIDVLSGIYAVYFQFLSVSPITLNEFANIIEDSGNDYGPIAANQLRGIINA